MHAQSAPKKFRHEHNLLRAQLSAADSAAVRVDSARTEPKIFISTATFAAAAFLDRFTGEGRRSTRPDTTFTMCVLFIDFKGGQSNNERLASMADLEGPVTWLHVGGPTSDPHSLRQAVCWVWRAVVTMLKIAACGWAHFGHTWAQTEAISGNQIQC